MRTNRMAAPKAVCLLGLCAAALAGVAPAAHAAVVVFNTPISVPQTVEGICINFLTGEAGGYWQVGAGWDFNPYAGLATLQYFWNTANGTSTVGGVAAAWDGPYLDLPVGSVVSSASTFNASPGVTLAFQSAGTHVLGFRFWNESTSAINYGYANLSVGGSNGFPLVITGWAYEDSGAAISLSQPVPEPGSAALLTLGALALGAIKRRRAG